MQTGVYQIRNLINGKLYIGSAAQDRGLTKRWINHTTKLRTNKHHNRHLQKAWNKYGADTFWFEILEECKPEQCIEREQYYLDTLLFADCDDNRFRQLGYNICRVADSCFGIKRSEETRAKMSKAQIGNQHAFGAKRSEETRTKMGVAKMGNKYSLGCRRSTKHKATISKLKRGTGNQNAKLVEADIYEIHTLLSQEWTQNMIAQKFDVTQGVISRIKTGKAWKYIR